MSTQFEWQEAYNIGVDVIDQEHQRLVRIINKLFRFREEEKDVSGPARKESSILKAMR